LNAANPWDLTVQEQTVLDLISSGHAECVIAQRMGLSTSRISRIANAAMERMQCANRTRAAVLWDRFAYGREDGK
jgi:DNA-binding NarL/FixJ family response regulator